MATQITENPSVKSAVEVLRPSMPDVFSSVHVSRSPQLWRRLLGFIGPGFLISVGYMDPGNWATDLAAGSRYGYTLLFVIMLSNLMAILLQSLAIKLGVATEQDLAQACRAHYSRPAAVGLWIIAEIAIAACDLAEVIGSAIALQLLFHLPLIIGVLITSLDVLLILLLEHRGPEQVRGEIDAARRQHQIHPGERRGDNRRQRPVQRLHVWTGAFDRGPGGPRRGSRGRLL